MLENVVAGSVARTHSGSTTPFGLALEREVRSWSAALTRGDVACGVPGPGRASGTGTGRGPLHPPRAGK